MAEMTPQKALEILEMFLCKPCAEEMKNDEAVKEFRYDRPARDKGTCERCGRRRFGYVCSVASKNRKG